MQPPGRIALAVALALAAGVACGGPAPIVDCVARDGVTPLCAFQNPEDLAVLSEDWLVVSQGARPDRAGSLLAFRPRDEARHVLWPGERAATRPRGDPRCPGPPDPAAFAPHGIDPTRDGTSLLVVNHGGREAVEVFEIVRASGAPALQWVDCVPMPSDATMNDLAALPGGGFVISQMTDGTTLGMLRLAAGRVSGRVHHHPPGGPLSAIPGSDGVGPNGVEVSPDGRTVFFAEWARARLVRIGLDGSDRRVAPLGFNPDNLTWRSDGRLLVGGQLATPLEATACFDVAEGTCGLPSAAAAVDPVTLDVERVWTHDPATVAGGISVALEHGDRIWLGSFGGDRLAWIPAVR
jgi:hypothetical protein